MRTRANSFGWGIVAGFALKWWLDVSAELRALRSFGWGSVK